MKYKLSDLFELQMGKTPSRDNPEYWSQPEFPWISIADLSNADKYIYDTKESLSRQAVEESGIKIIPAQTVIMSFKLSIGKVSITPVPMYSNEAIMAFIDKGIIKIKPEYLYYLLLHRNWDEGTNKAVMGKTLNKATLSEVVIDIHPIEEQERIVTILDKASEIIDSYQRKLRTLDTLIKARFVEMFGNDDTYLKHAQHIVADVCESRVGIVIQPTQYYTEDKDRGIRAFRSMNVKPFTVYDQEWVYFSKEDNDRLARTQIHANDVAVVRSGANLGDSCVISEEFEGCNAIDILLLTCSKQVLPVYLCAFINYPVGKSQILNVQRGGAIKHLNLRQLEQSAIYIPPLEEQYKFADFVSQVDKSKFAVQAALDKAQLLFNSLIQQYFGC